MAGITLEQAQAKLALWMAADDAVSRDQEHWVEGRRVTRADARTIRQSIDYWNQQVKRLTPSKVARVRYMRAR